VWVALRQLQQLTQFVYVMLSVGIDLYDMTESGGMRQRETEDRGSSFASPLRQPHNRYTVPRCVQSGKCIAGWVITRIVDHENGQTQFA
jgi:hypothetical protein